MTSTTGTQISLAVIFVLTSAGNAFAYIDPGMASMALQALIGGIAAGLVVIKLWWHKIVSFFRRAEGKTASTEGQR